ncbi:MAG TPA: YeeE/YedE family protein [Rhodospirillales bacterium]|jgi:uncharacterized membrane protein YedE/YeeE|nr:YeeE/YedE family protein [Rhodospirillales bacterium]
MENFTPLSATIGGVLIGLAATMLLLTQGRIAGISNIVGGLLETNEDDRLWRILFIVGLIVGSSTYVFFGENTSNININPFQLNDKNHMFFMILGGLLVGFGSQIGSGCTSGHGVCGLGRFSMRSLTATITFMVTAGITVFVVRSLTGA